MLVSQFPKGSKIYTDQVTGLNVNPVVNTPGSLSVSWNNPTSKKFAGVMVRYKTGSYPTSPTDGVQAYNGKGASVTINGLVGGTTYYVRAFAYASNSSGSKVIYNTTTAGAQVIQVTYANPVTNFVVSKTSASSLSASWTAPTGVYRQVMIRYKLGSYPTSITDGTQAYLGTGTSVVVSGLTASTTYYFRAFVSNTNTIYNTNITGQQANNVTKISAGQVVFSSSQMWTVPEGVKVVDVFCVGGGGATGVNDNAAYGIGGGGGGYTSTLLNQTVTPGTSYPVVVGAGGTPYRGTSPNAALIAGKPSSFGAILTADGGIGGFYTIGQRGGSGGGGGGNHDEVCNGGDGGSDGSAGLKSTSGRSGGAGQGTTTRAFGEGSNTLYAGGGGGGCHTTQYGTVRYGGVGGAGGGGRGAHYNGLPLPGTPNTGGGAGGPKSWGGDDAGAAGGAGIVIVRWVEQ